MTFAALQDFYFKVSQNILDQITEAQNTLVDDAEAQAIALIKDALDQKYDMQTEFAKTGTDRNLNLLRWVLNLSVYFLYQRVPDDQVPARVVKDYDDTRDEIKLIEQGKRNTAFARYIITDTNIVKTNFRWGSESKRTHF